MTPDQKRAVETAKALAKRLGRRPTGRELYEKGVTFATSSSFRNLHALLVAADLALPASSTHAGFTDAEERTLLRLWESGLPAKQIAAAMGVMPRILANEVDARRLKRSVVRRKKGEPEILLRRCQEPTCGKLTEGAGPCRHCGGPGLTNAA